MRHRIYFSVCGEGYGHSSRDMAIAEVLAASGAEVLMAGYGYVLERMKKSFRTTEVEREFEMDGHGGAFDMKRTISKSALSALRASKIVSCEEKAIRSFKATCIVADGRWAPIVAAFRLGLPCILVANQTTLKPFFAPGDFLLKSFGKNLELTLSASVVLSDIILIPDISPPDAVCIGTLSKEKHIKKKEVFVGPLISGGFYSAKKTRLDVKPPFVLTVLGGHAFRLPIFEGILKAAEKFPEITFLIFTKFKSDKIPKNVIIREFADDISQHMRASEMIITQAGHSTAMEILALGKPALVIPDRGQAEQEQNAQRMKEMGIAETLDYAHIKPGKIGEKIRMLLSDKKYAKNARKYSAMAKKMGGAKKAAEIILDYSGRVQAY